MVRVVACRTREPGFNPGSFLMISPVGFKVAEKRTCQTSIVWCLHTPIYIVAKGFLEIAVLPKKLPRIRIFWILNDYVCLHQIPFYCVNR